MFCEMSPIATNCVTDPLDGSVDLCERFVKREKEFRLLP